MKKAISVLIILSVITGIFSSVVFAAEPLISVNSSIAFTGEEVKLEISLNNNPGITTMYLDIEYDKTLELKSVNDTGLLKGALFSEDISAYPYCVSWDDALSTEDNHSNGVIAELIFYVRENTPCGSYNVSISYDSEEIYNKELTDVSFRTSGGSINVSEKKSKFVKFSDAFAYVAPFTEICDFLKEMPYGTKVLEKNGADLSDGYFSTGHRIKRVNGDEYKCIIMGDVDSDGDISSSDARLVLRRAVNLEIFDETAEKAADVDFSGEIDSGDARNILRASVGLESSVEWFKRIDVSLISSSLYAANGRYYYKDQNVESYDAAGAYVKEQILNFETYINVMNFNIARVDAEAFADEYIFNEPSLFIINTPISVSYSGNQLASISVSFINGAEEKLEYYNNEIEYLVSLADEDMSELEIVLFYHDYIVSHFSYDLDYVIHDAYNLLKEKEGVCQAYALLYIELINKFGIPVEYVVSEGMNHAWNAVKLGKYWYHIDATWDDPVYDIYGRAMHEYFLLSDKQMQRKEHYGWSVTGASIKCSDTSYDNYFWTSVNSPFVYLDDLWYYIGYSETEFDYRLFEGSELTTGKPVLRVGDDDWTNTNGSNYLGNFSGLGVFNNKIIFNTPSEIFAYSPETSELESLFSETGEKAICGISVDRGIFYNYAYTPYDEIQDIRTVKLAVTGDMNYDGRINAKDHTLLVRFINGYPINAVLVMADINKDGICTDDDAAALRFFLVNNYYK